MEYGTLSDSCLLKPKIADFKLFMQYDTHKKTFYTGYVIHHLDGTGHNDTIVLVCTDAIYLIQSKCEICFICVWAWKSKNALCLLWPE